ncbi:hypothetical protein NCCP2716_16190 [Sporosarcina sp. NCCP-2716]|uniref:alpha-ribazole-5-phosphate synthase n=1 Tax=Sporosarcina sp. NCCP-2716 TaxID=2943679 RepID=UPI00203B18B1|nr:alpha-ribazole-5-phosphate synthase [Sporosarcina sp. NCCP-2716]GKV69121.1 hypothetical protein NCCP2716_16190 [Sporosarcina sp. NCCP-2716]
MSSPRNALEIGGLIVTTDNSGGIGEKPDDLVAVPDRITARFAARVCLLEQWAAGAEPEAVLLHNFSGGASWEAYCTGVRDIFDEIGEPAPPISGSTETNMELRQSALTVTFLGRAAASPSGSSGDWFTYGTPLVGEAVLTEAADIASLAVLQEVRRLCIPMRIWPVGSAGILAELMIADPAAAARIAGSPLDLHTSAGPATVVLLQIPAAAQPAARKYFGRQLRPLTVPAGE